MPNFHPCWVREKAIPEQLCDLIISESNSFEWEDGKVGGYMPDPNYKNRDANVTWLEHNHWLEGILINNGLYANRECGWNFEVEASEKVQFTKYHINGYHDWHMDACLDEGNDFVRKITVVALLSDTTDFDGGQFMLQHKSDQIIPLKKGSIICFPSFMWHSVTPITRGNRYTAVSWINGKMFK